MKYFFSILISFFSIVSSAQTIIIFPGDDWMEENGFAKWENVQGQNTLLCDYNRAVLNSEFRSIVNRFGKLFKSENFEITTLQDALGELDMTNALNSVQDLDQSPTELILNGVNPDIKIDISWRIQGGLYKSVKLDAVAKDPKSSQTLSAISFTSTESRSVDIESAVEDMLRGDFTNFIDEIKTAYIDRTQNGQKLSLLINTDSNSQYNMASEFGDDTLSDLVYDFLKSYAKNGKVGAQNGSDTNFKCQNIRVEAEANCVRQLQRAVIKYLKSIGVPAYYKSTRQGTVQITLGEKN